VKVDLQRLDNKIRKLQQVRAFAADQEFVELFLEFLSNQNDKIEAVRSQNSAAATKAYLPRDGSLSAHVFTVCRDFGNDTFTAQEVTDELEKQKVPIEAKNKYLAVIGIMKKLVDRGLLKVVESFGRRKQKYANV
jgi:hypothetical protein